MLTIGRAPRLSAGDSPAALLLECHARIRRHVRLALRLAHADAPAPEQITEAAAACVRYFTIALPLHTADEELSLRPRLEAAAADAALSRALATMAREHAPIDAIIAELVPLWSGLITEPNRRPDRRPPLGAGAVRLAELFDAHLAAEERDIFPVIAQRLPPEAQTALIAEIRARRESPGARVEPGRNQ